LSLLWLCLTLTCLRFVQRQHSRTGSLHRRPKLGAHPPSVPHAAKAANLWHGQVQVAPWSGETKTSIVLLACRGWRDVQRYIAEGPAHLIAEHGHDFATGALLLAAVVANAPIGDVPAFIAARTDGGSGGGETEGVADGGPCVSPGAVELLLRELAALPLNQVLRHFATCHGTSAAAQR
jgi:hypothetical protein